MDFAGAIVIINNLKGELVAAIDEVNALRDKHNKDPLQPADHWDKEGVHDAYVWLVNNQRSTNMNNLDMPAIPVIDHNGVFIQGDLAAIGFTKREQACLTMGVADTGCAELDAIIEQGNKQRLAGLAMLALVTSHGNDGDGACNPLADKYAEALLKQLKSDV
tara:strand:+ start:773 stop:1258 length:486 start_codon:yes stop_codon:yes gene_type:complete